MAFELGRHGGYIIAAYGATALVLGWMIIASLAGRARAERQLAEAEARLSGEGPTP
jgi:heme exporter protein CcmD